MGRATQGVRLIKVREDDAIAAVAKVMHSEDDVDEDELEGAEGASEENGTPLDNETNQTDNNE